MIRADTAAAGLVEQAIARRQHHHWNGAEGTVALEQRAGLIAIQARHHDIDEDDVRALVGDLGQGVETIERRDHLATGLFEQQLGGAANRLGVVDHHDLEGGRLFHVGSMNVRAWAQPEPF